MWLDRKVGRSFLKRRCKLCLQSWGDLEPTQPLNFFAGHPQHRAAREGSKAALSPRNTPRPRAGSHWFCPLRSIYWVLGGGSLQVWVEKPVFRSPCTTPGACVGKQPPMSAVPGHGAGKDHYVPAGCRVSVLLCRC